MNEKILYLPIETQSRELDSKLLLAHAALKRGYKVFIGSRGAILRIAKKNGFGVYLAKDYKLRSFPQVCDSTRPHYIFVGLDEEGLVFIDDDKYLKRKNLTELKNLDIILTWGDYQRNVIAKKYPALSHKAFSVGNPRFDLLRPEVSPYFERYASNAKFSYKGNYVLINTNFAPGNMSVQYKLDYYNHVKREYELSNIEVDQGIADYILERKDYYNMLFNKYVEMLLEVAPLYPNITFIIRPHPSEDIDTWRNHVNLPNVTVIREGNVIGWIKNSIAVIHTGCTTGIEAWAIQKPVIQYNPCENPNQESPLPNRFGYKATTISKLCKLIDEAFSGKLTIDESYIKQIKIAKPFIKNITGKYSTERILDVIESITGKIDCKNNNNLNIYWKQHAIKLKIKHIVARLLRNNEPIVNKVFGIKKSNSLLFKSLKISGITESYVNKMLKTYDYIQNKEGQEYIIKEILLDTFIIER